MKFDFGEIKEELMDGLPLNNQDPVIPPTVDEERHPSAHQVLLVEQERRQPLYDYMAPVVNRQPFCITTPNPTQPFKLKSFLLRKGGNF